MKKAALVVGLCLLLTGLAMGGTQKTTISVMDLNTSSGLSQKELSLLTDKLLNSLVEYRVYDVVERSKRDEILKEQGFQMTGACSEASCLVEIGQLLGAQKMIGGTIGKLGAIYVVELRMIDIQSGGIDLSFSRNYGKIADLLTAMKEAAEIFSSWKPGAGQSSKPGGLFVVTEPDGAKILVDGKEHTGLTPNLIYPLSEGLHQISLVKEGYSLFSTSRLVSIGKVDTINAPLMSLAGKLKIKTDPAGAKLYLNKKYQGIVTEQGITIEDLTDSLYKIKATKWGYRSYKAAISPSPGRETRVDAKLPLNRWMLMLSGGSVLGASEAATDLYLSTTQPTDITDADVKGEAIAGTAGLGCNISRNFAISLMYQFKGIPNAIDEFIEKSSSFNIGDTTAYMDAEKEVEILTHSFLLGLTVSVPWGRLEPYGEFRGGLSKHIVKQEYEYQYNRSYHDSANVYHVVRDSNVTKTYDKSAGNFNCQIGGGFKLWLSQKTALQLSCLYNYDKARHIHTYENGPDVITNDVDLRTSGLMPGLGLGFHF